MPTARRCHCGLQACHLLVLARVCLSAGSTPSPPSATPQPSQPKATAHLDPTPAPGLAPAARRGDARLRGGGRRGHILASSRWRAAAGRPPHASSTPGRLSPKNFPHSGCNARARRDDIVGAARVSCFSHEGGRGCSAGSPAYGWRSPIAGGSSPGETRGGSLRVGGVGTELAIRDFEVQQRLGAGRGGTEGGAAAASAIPRSFPPTPRRSAPPPRPPLSPTARAPPAPEPRPPPR